MVNNLKKPVILVVRLVTTVFLGGSVAFVAARFAETPLPAVLPMVGQHSGAYAFVNASPLLVFDTPTMVGGHKQDFDFGTVYKIDERGARYVRVTLGNGQQVYLLPENVTTVYAPRWLMTRTAYNKSERELIRLWESETKLQNFLSGTDTAGSRWDYEEFFEGPPQFSLKLPVVYENSVNLLRGDRLVKLVSVMMPISRSMYRAFERAKSGFDKKLDLYLLVDVSLSTKDFLEGTVRAIAKVLAQNESMRSRVGSIAVAIFGIGRGEKARFIGTLSLKELESFVWHRSDVGQPPIGEREPLIEGLVAISRGVRANADGVPILVILSGADVELVSYIGSSGKLVAIEDLDLTLPSDASAIFVQITPEPSEDLRNASQRFRQVSRTNYVEYSDVLTDDIVSNVLQATESPEAKANVARALNAVAEAAHERQTMAFMPRVLTSVAQLPAKQSYASDADWYTVRLWLAVDELIWEEGSK